MHGSSSVPQEWLNIIRKYGGEMKETYGVPVEEIQEGIKHGVRKVNIDTDIRLAMTGAVRRHLFNNKSEFDPRKFLKDATAAAKDILPPFFETIVIISFIMPPDVDMMAVEPLDKMPD